MDERDKKKQGATEEELNELIGSMLADKASSAKTEESGGIDIDTDKLIAEITAETENDSAADKNGSAEPDEQTDAEIPQKPESFGVEDFEKAVYGENIIEEKMSSDEACAEEVTDAVSDEEISDEEASADDGSEEYEDDFDYSEMYRELEKSRRNKRKKKNKGKLAFGLFFTALIIAVSVGIAVLVIRAARAITGIDRDDTQVVIDIPENSTAADIAAILYDEGIIGDEKLFILFSRTKNADGGYIAGSHVLSPNMPYDEIITALQKTEETEERETVDITFPEGITLYDAAAKLEEYGVCKAERFIYIFNSSSFGFDFEIKVKNSPDKFTKMEGYFFPDTYSFYVDEEPEIVAKKIYRNFENKFTPDLYGRMNDLGMSLDETITLASMIQAEGNNPKDMKLISSVFHNRLKSRDFPRLQSDPTSKYVENVIKPNIEIPNENMYINYDTYKGEGLPPGAICNPGLDAIKAALYPEETEYYYFCADIETGEVFYAETLEEHEENLYEAGLSDKQPQKKKKKKSTEETSEETADE